MFSHLQIPKRLVDNPEDFPIIRWIPDAILKLVSLSNHVLIRYFELIGDVPRGAIPKKARTKSKGVVIQEPTGDEKQPKKHKFTGVLKTMASKKQVTNLVKKKKKVVETIVLGLTKDEETDTEDIDMSKGQSSNYTCDANIYDVDHSINDLFHQYTPLVSPRKVATIESNTEEISNSDVTMNTSNVDTYIIKDETPSTYHPQSTATVNPLEFPTTKSIMEEVRTLDIPEHTSHVDSNLNMDENFRMKTSTVPPLRPTSLFITSVVQTGMVPTRSPTFYGILSQPIAMLFSSQSTNSQLGLIHDDTLHMQDKEDEGFGFEETFDLEEEDIEDKALMSGKQ